MTNKTGVLLINLGTPDAPTRSAVKRYLNEFLMDGRVIDIPAFSRYILVKGIIAPTRSGKSAKAYQRLWTKEGSPLKTYGYELVDKVQNLLGEGYQVELAMRYQSPSIESALRKLLQNNPNEIVVFPLFPQYASASTGTALEEVMRVLMREQAIPSLRMLTDYYDHPAYIKAFVDKAAAHNLAEYDHVLFSYHGLPKRQLRKADRHKFCLTPGCCDKMRLENRYCYSAQCQATTQALAKELGLTPDQYTVSFQSRLGKDPWLEPYTSEVLKKCAESGKKKILVFSPGFVADCLETTVEVAMEYAEEFQHWGGEKLQLVESLNSGDVWAKAIVEMLDFKC